MTIDNFKVKTQNSVFTVYKIPFSKISKANVSLKDKNKSYTLQQHVNDNKWDIGINGAMFDMNTYQNVTDLIVSGNLNNGGNYSSTGIAFGNDFRKIGAYKSTTSNSKGNPVDFIGGAPTLIIDGKINLDMKGLTKSFTTAKTQRTAIGVGKDAEYFIAILSTLNNTADLTQVANELLYQNCTIAINLDGGGSTAVYTTKYLRKGRNIPSAFGITLNKETDGNQPNKGGTSMAQKYVILDAGHSELTAGKRAFDSSFFEYEFNLDVANRISKILSNHGLKTKVVQVKNKNNSAELKERVRIINQEKPDVMVSIHANAFGSTWNEAHGWEVFCYNKTKGEGLKLAQSIQKASIPYLGLTNRGIKDNSLYVVSHTNCPAALVEHAFYTNKTELALLKSSDFRDKCAIADAKGILSYLGIAYNESAKPPNTTTNTNTNTSTNSNGKLYRVQTGAFLLRGNADKLVKELLAKGFNSFVKKEGLYNKVQLGAFSDKKNAENLAKELSTYGYKTVVV